jgi:hypothetical protein
MRVAGTEDADSGARVGAAEVLPGTDPTRTCISANQGFEAGDAATQEPHLLGRRPLSAF